MNCLVDTQDSSNSHLVAGFFAYLSRSGASRRLANLDVSDRLAVERALPISLADQKHVLPADNNG